MIPTRYKSKVPHTFSYPVGAEAVSEALMGVPQFNDLTLHFWHWKSRKWETTLPNEVLDVWYSGPFQVFSKPQQPDSDIDEPKWQITVYAVPTSLRHAIQGKIVTEALPAIRIWLAANYHSSEREGRHGLVFLYDEAADLLKHDERKSLLWQTVRHR